MKSPRAFVVEPLEDRAQTRRRVVARGSDQPIEGKLVRTRAALVVKAESGKPKRIGTDTEIVEVSTPANTKPTRQVQHAKNLFALLNPDADPPPPVVTVSAIPVARPMSPLEQSIARRDTHRTRRMQFAESELVETGPDGTLTGQIPLVDWTPARVPSIEIEVEVPPHVVRHATHQSYRKGLVMGVALATSVGAALAAVLALVM
jgi:hypothetical protein